MMTPRIHASVAMALASSLLGGSVSAFSASSIERKPFTASATMALNAVAHLSADSEDDAMYLMLKARDCAHSDTCTIEQAEDFLREVVHVQSNCVTGTLAGHDLCDDPAFASEIIADLRAKIKNGAKAEGKTFWEKRQEELEDLAMASTTSDGTVSPIAALTQAPIKPVYLGLAALYATLVISAVHSDSSVTPFTAQEWWWALRDGYISDMFSAYIRNGGLLALADPEPVASFTSQEWMWALKDGYLGNMVSDFARNGGFAEQETVTPFTSQEWMWALKDGYLGTMVSDFARNGGL